LNQIILFGAELSKVYTVTLGPHPREHLPLFAEKIYRSLTRAGERIELATKGEVIEDLEKPSEEPLPQKKEESTKQKETKKEPEKDQERTMELSIKIKTQEKKPKTED
jgi:hypothetical protein